jgi:hypothetical protein
MRSISRRTAGLAVVIAGLMACGCSGPSTTGPSAPATETSTMVVLSQTLEDVAAGDQRTVNFSLPHRGTLVLTVRWNDPNNTVIAVLTGTNCLDLRNLDGDCRVRRSIERQGKQGREQVIESPDAAGAYRLLVENEGPGTESVRVNAELTFEVAVPAAPAPEPSSPPERTTPTPRRSWEP